MVGFVESVKTGRHSLFHEMIDGIRGTVRGEGSYRGLDVWRLKEGNGNEVVHDSVFIVA